MTTKIEWCNAGNGWLHVGDGDETFSEYAEGQTIPQPDHDRYPNLLHEYLWPLPNLWLCVTVCNQEEADEKIPLLLQVPAIKRGVSIEPMLGPVNFHLEDLVGQTWDTLRGGITAESSGLGIFTAYQETPALDWVICGGETGPGARPMHPDWVRGLRDQCQGARVPFFFKSWGEWVTENQSPEDILLPGQSTIPHGWKGRKYEESVYRVGKRRAGRLLDGREWNEAPEVKA